MTYRFLIFFFLLPGLVFAQAQVRESTESTVSTQTTPSVEQSSTTANLVYDLQALQQEVLELRGQLEQQAHEIQRLKKQRLDDYLDLDKRLSDLTRELNQQPATNSATPSVATAPTTNSSTTSIPQVTLPTTTGDGDELYNTAINMLLNEQNYAGAQEKFTEYLKSYPQGRYVPNVYYWQGQVLFAGGKRQEAAKVFDKLIKEHPSHPKTSDGKFKLAKIYFDQGKKDQAKALLTEVAASDTDATLLAKSFLSKNY